MKYGLECKDKDKFIDLEWKDKHDKKRNLRAYRSPNTTLDDVPLMFVGVGGTGIDAVLTLKEKIETIYNPEQFERIEYLLIDTDKIGSGRSINQSDTIIVQSSDTAMLLREAQHNTGASHFIANEIREWLDRSISPFRVMNGAAGIRQAGRLILFLNFQTIYDTIQRKIQKISKHYDGSVCRPKVFLFTGIGGGTGSGMFVDLSYLIRSVQNVDLHGVIFMPDVSCLKPNLREIHKKNIQRNGFAALKELDYLMTLDRFNESFRQDYPNGISVDMSYPIFDLCMLVGAQEDGRKPVESEQEVFEKAAEYILFEIQGKISEFGMVSYKSNLANKLPKEPLCDRYVAIGAAASYVAIDYYYSWWLRDVLRTFCLNGDISEERDYEEEIEFEIGEDVKDEVAHTPYQRWRRYKHAQEHISQNMRSQLASGIMLPSHFFLIWNENYTNVEEEVCKVVDNVSLTGVKRDNIQQTLLLKKWRLRRVYKKAYKSCFGKWIKGHEELTKSNCEILKKIIARMEAYDTAKIIKLPGQFVLGKDEFEQVRQQDCYKKSIEEAAKTLAEDMYKNADRWNGVASGSPKWLSEYVAKLLKGYFDCSGCVDLNMLIKCSAPSGYNGQEKFLHDCLTKLDAKQLWPRSPHYAKNDDYHRMLVGPASEPIKTWIEDWISTSGEGDVFCANPVYWRFARAILVPGNALYGYDGIGALERCYLDAPNKAGLHLYASPDKDWSKLPSPYFETKWVTGDATKREAERERNEHFRKIFDEALDCGIIERLNDGFYYIVEEGKRVRIGDIKGNEGGAGNEEEKAMAKNMFIHMFEHRQWVKNKLDPNKPSP